MTDLDQAIWALSSPDAAVRANAAHALGAHADASHVGPMLMRLLADGDELVRSETVDALGRLAYVPALDALRLLLRTDRSAIVRADAAETLGDLGQPAAIADLVAALADEDAAVRGYAANSIGLLAAPDLLPIFDRRLEMESAPAVRAEIHGARYRLGATSALDDLLGLLEVMDGDLGINILNIWDDLTGRRRPPTLMTDAPRIAETLTRVGERLPALRSHAGELAARLQP